MSERSEREDEPINPVRLVIDAEVTATAIKARDLVTGFLEHQLIDFSGADQIAFRIERSPDELGSHGGSVEEVYIKYDPRNRKLVRVVQEHVYGGRRSSAKVLPVESWLVHYPQVLEIAENIKNQVNRRGSMQSTLPS